MIIIIITIIIIHSASAFLYQYIGVLGKERNVGKEYYNVLPTI